MNWLQGGVAVAAAVAIGGCAGPAQTVRAGDAPAVLVDSAIVARFSDSGMEGGAVKVQRDDDSLQGVASGVPVELRWTDDEVSGTYRKAPVQLTVKHEVDAAVADGELEGALASFRYSRKAVEGVLGNCAFSLQHIDGANFQGVRTCVAGRREPMALTVPQRLWQRPDSERAAWLALFIAEYQPMERRSIAPPTVAFKSERDGNAHN